MQAFFKPAALFTPWVLRRLCAIPFFMLMASCNPEPGLDVMVPMRDGIKLATDVYLPSRPALPGYPVLLLRTPYGKQHLADMGEQVSANGIAVVAQDIRGQGKSEGANILFEADGWGSLRDDQITLQDGRDTLDWIAGQRWCNGRIATHGWSALGLLEYLLQGACGHDSLVFQNIVAAPVSTYEGLFFSGGMFRQSEVEQWLPWLQTAAQGAEAIFRDHYTKDAYWDYQDLTTRSDCITTPAYHYAGWFDAFQMQTIGAFTTYVGAGAPDQHLVIGPWTHDTFYASEQNELVFPENAAQGYYLKEGDPGILTLASYLKYGKNFYSYPAVAYYTMGDVAAASALSNAWQYADRFPPAGAETMQLCLQDDGAMAAGGCAGAGVVSYAFSTDSPVPTLCGANLFEGAGPCDISAYDDRQDMLFFATAPVSGPTEITGAVTLHLKASIDKADADFVAFVVDSYPGGGKYLMLERGRKVRFRESFSRERFVDAGQWFEMDIPLGYTSLMLDTGHRLGLYLANTNAPKYKLPSCSHDYWDDTACACQVQVDLSGTWLSVDVVNGWQ